MVWSVLVLLLRSRASLEAEILILRHQLNIQRRHLPKKQRSSGGKDRLGSISKQGDRYLRGLFVAGALAVIRYAKICSSCRRSHSAAVWAY